MGTKKKVTYTNQQISQMQEATIVTAPIFHKKKPKSKAEVIGGWLVYWAISWGITLLLLFATGLSEQMNRSSIPWWVQSFIIPSTPFLLTLVWSIFKLKKVRKQKDAGD